MIREDRYKTLIPKHKNKDWEAKMFARKNDLEISEVILIGGGFLSR